MSIYENPGYHTALRHEAVQPLISLRNTNERSPQMYQWLFKDYGSEHSLKILTMTIEGKEAFAITNGSGFLYIVYNPIDFIEEQDFNFYEDRGIHTLYHYLFADGMYLLFKILSSGSFPLELGWFFLPTILKLFSIGQMVLPDFLLEMKEEEYVELCLYTGLPLKGIGDFLKGPEYDHDQNYESFMKSVAKQGSRSAGVRLFKALVDSQAGQSKLNSLSSRLDALDEISSKFGKFFTSVLNEEIVKPHVANNKLFDYCIKGKETLNPAYNRKPHSPDYMTKCQPLTI